VGLPVVQHAACNQTRHWSVVTHWDAWRLREEPLREADDNVPRHCSLGFDVMYHGAGGAGHGGLLVADGKRPVTVYEEKFYK